MGIKRRRIGDPVPVSDPVTPPIIAPPSAPPPGKFQSLMNALGMATRVGGGWASSRGGIPGALIGTIAESGAQIFENMPRTPEALSAIPELWAAPTDDTGYASEVSRARQAGLLEGIKTPLARIGVEAAVSAVPATSTMIGGSPIRSAVRTGLLTGIGEAGRQKARGEDLNWGNIAGAAGLGGVAGGAIARFIPPPPPSVGPSTWDRLKTVLTPKAKTPTKAPLVVEPTSVSDRVIDRGNPYKIPSKPAQPVYGPQPRDLSGYGTQPPVLSREAYNAQRIARGQGPLLERYGPSGAPGGYVQPTPAAEVFDEGRIPYGVPDASSRMLKAQAAQEKAAAQTTRRATLKTELESLNKGKITGRTSRSAKDPATGETVSIGQSYGTKAAGDETSGVVDELADMLMGGPTKAPSSSPVPSVGGVISDVIEEAPKAAPIAIRRLSPAERRQMSVLNAEGAFDDMPESIRKGINEWINAGLGPRAAYLRVINKGEVPKGVENPFRPPTPPSTPTPEVSAVPPPAATTEPVIPITPPVDVVTPSTSPTESLKDLLSGKSVSIQTPRVSSY